MLAIMRFVTPDPAPDNQPIRPHTVLELGGEMRVLMDDLLDSLGNLADVTVTAEDLTRALRSLRERDRVIVELENEQHLALLVARLREMKDGPIF
jgi:hypothetical protein